MKKDDFLAAHGLDKPYDPIANEDRLYTAWNDTGYFNPDTLIEKGFTDKAAPSFSMVLPPPNVTGILHLGHAAMLAIEDIVIRYRRMNGFRTLWLPGTDHAAIATQSKVEKDMQKEGVRRSDLSRDEFMARINAYAEASRGTINSQVRKMGASVDWSREAYTLDAPREKAVRTAFKLMYDAGLIYRGGRIVNWDPKGQTTISDDELVYKDETSKFYYLKYGPFTIATARPETKFGDKYVVVHPEDPRYAEYKHGQTFEIEWINGPLTATVIKDPIIDMEFGTGAMTITPWHSVEDFDLAERHKLDKEQIIDLYGKLLPVAGEFANKKIAEARPLIIEKLAAKGLLVKTEDNYTHRIATAERTGAVVEPQIMTQWFIDVNKKFAANEGQKKILGNSATETTLKELMIAAVRNGHIKILPERFEKIYFNWIDNLRDWCISRQIIFGHQIPVWYKHKNTPQQEIAVGMAPEGSVGAQDEKWEQDPDTLDTWFSSGLWTFSTLGWPDAAATAKKGETGPEHDFANFHPTDLLETGYDIIFFWVARMILMSTYLLGEIPFKTVYLHGLVRDAKGEKMSKSLGNSLDPIDMSSKYSADAVRLSLIIGTGPGSDSRLSEDKIRGYRNFGNKLWNISRFILGAAVEVDESVRNGTHPLLPADQALVDECRDVIKSATTDIEQYMLHLAGEKLYAYAWHRLADVILEESKPILASTESTDDAARLSRISALCQILHMTTLALHPFIPFVTEAIYAALAAAKVCDNHDRPHAIVAKWPVHG